LDNTVVDTTLLMMMMMMIIIIIINLITIKKILLCLSDHFNILHT